jgi:gluconate kinase
LLDSQFADLAEPAPSEDVLTVEIGADPRDVAEKIKVSLRKRAE